MLAPDPKGIQMYYPIQTSALKQIHGVPNVLSLFVDLIIFVNFLMAAQHLRASAADCYSTKMRIGYFNDAYLTDKDECDIFTHGWSQKHATHAMLGSA